MTSVFFTSKKLLLSDATAETLGEAINTTTSRSFFLLAGVEWVAFAAHVYVEVFAQSRASFEGVAT